jgi:TolA-binding protein
VAQATPTSTYSVGQAQQGRLPQISQQTGIASAQSPAGARVAALESEISKMQGGERLNQMAAQQGGVQREMMDTLSGGRGGAGLPLSGMSADDVALQAATAQRKATAGRLYPKGEVTGDARIDEIMSRPAVETADRVVGAAEANMPKSMVTQGARPADTLMNTPKQTRSILLNR